MKFLLLIPLMLVQLALCREEVPLGALCDAPRCLHLSWLLRTPPSNDILTCVREPTSVCISKSDEHEEITMFYNDSLVLMDFKNNPDNTTILSSVEVISFLSNSTFKYAVDCLSVALRDEAHPHHSLCNNTYQYSLAPANQLIQSFFKILLREKRDVHSEKSLTPPTFRVRTVPMEDMYSAVLEFESEDSTTVLVHWFQDSREDNVKYSLILYQLASHFAGTRNHTEKEVSQEYNYSFNLVNKEEVQVVNTSIDITLPLEYKEDDLYNILTDLFVFTSPPNITTTYEGHHDPQNVASEEMWNIPLDLKVLSSDCPELVTEKFDLELILQKFEESKKALNISVHSDLFDIGVLAVAEDGLENSTRLISYQSRCKDWKETEFDITRKVEITENMTTDNLYATSSWLTIKSIGSWNSNETIYDRTIIFYFNNNEFLPDLELIMEFRNHSDYHIILKERCSKKRYELIYNTRSGSWILVFGRQEVKRQDLIERVPLVKLGVIVLENKDLSLSRHVNPEIFILLEELLNRFYIVKDALLQNNVKVNNIIQKIFGDCEALIPAYEKIDNLWNALKLKLYHFFVDFQNLSPLTVRVKNVAPFISAPNPDQVVIHIPQIKKFIQYSRSIFEEKKLLYWIAEVGNIVAPFL